MKKLDEAQRSHTDHSEIHNIILPRRTYPINWREANIHFQRKFLAAVLAKHNGNKSQAARSLGISRRTLQLKIRTQDQD